MLLPPPTSKKCPAFDFRTSTHRYVTSFTLKDSRSDLTQLFKIPRYKMEMLSVYNPDQFHRSFLALSMKIPQATMLELMNIHFSLWDRLQVKRSLNTSTTHPIWSAVSNHFLQ